MALQCMIITRDRATAEMLSALLLEGGTSPTVEDDPAEGFETLQEIKFDAVFLDSDLEGTVPFVAELRRHTTLNRTVIVLVVGSDPERLREASRNGADIVQAKPLSPELARKTVQLARSLMITERRRYFRHPLEGFAEMRLEKESAPVHLTNISEGGLALHCKHELNVGARVEIEFYLPGEKTLLHARAIVSWVKPGQRAGLRFEHFYSGTRAILDAWLDKQQAALAPDVTG
jgi:DNA-binding response OmpR family regulator